MKVTRNNNGFAPITVVLETEQEANMMYDVFNSPTGNFKEAYTCSRWNGLPDFAEVKSRMWNQFERVFTPKPVRKEEVE